MPSGNNEYGSKAVLPRDRFTIHILYSFFTEKPRPLGPRLFRIYSYSSPACFFLPQGLFPPPGFIPGLLFFTPGMISAAQIHPQLAFSFRRDYFGRTDSSPACSFLPQGLFRPPGFIPGLLFFTTGIISAAQIHPQLALFLRRDYFDRPDSSSASFFLPQII